MTVCHVIRNNPFSKKNKEKERKKVGKIVTECRMTYRTTNGSTAAMLGIDVPLLLTPPLTSLDDLQKQNKAKKQTS